MTLKVNEIKPSDPPHSRRSVPSPTGTFLSKDDLERIYTLSIAMENISHHLVKELKTEVHF